MVNLKSKMDFHQSENVLPYQNMDFETKLRRELSQWVFKIWTSEKVRLKALDAYFSKIDMSGDVEYSTCDQYRICVKLALFEIL